MDRTSGTFGKKFQRFTQSFHAVPERNMSMRRQQINNKIRHARPNAPGEVDLRERRQPRSLPLPLVSFKPSPPKSAVRAVGGVFSLDINTPSKDTRLRASSRALASKRDTPCLLQYSDTMGIPKANALVELLSLTLARAVRNRWQQLLCLRPPSNARCCSLRLKVLMMNSLRTRESSRLILEVFIRSMESSLSLVMSVLRINRKQRQALGLAVGISKSDIPTAIRQM